MKKFLFCFLLILGLIKNAQSQSNDTPPNAQPGKCYAKCIMPESTTENPILAWEEVLCGDKITDFLVSDIVNALINKGYKLNNSAKIMNAETKATLNKFQKTFNLPIGSLNIKTLDALGVRY